MSVMPADLDTLRRLAAEHSAAERARVDDEQQALLRSAHTPEERAKITFQGRIAAPPPPRFVDLVVSAPKSVSLYWASTLSARQPEKAEIVARAHDAGVIAALDYLQREAGYAMIQHSPHSATRYVDAELQFHRLDHVAHNGGTGDMHLHTHLILDGYATVHHQHRPIYLDGVHRALPAVETMYERGMQHALTSRLPLEFARDERGRLQLLGITPAEYGAFPGTACPTPFMQLMIPAP